MATLLERKEKKCTEQFLCAFFQQSGKREIGELLIIRNFWTKD